MATIAFYLFGMTSILYVGHLGFYLIGASFYDVWQQKRQFRLIRAKTSTVYSPSVTVLIPAHNEEKVIIRCLKSVFDSSYKNIDVIVINDASTDTTKQILSRYSGLGQPGFRVINKRINAGKGASLNYALKRYAKAELVMMLDADSILSPMAIERAVSYFVDPTIAGVAANVQIINEHTTMSILQKFEHMISYRSKKAFSLTNCEFVIGGVASTYRREVIRSVGHYDTDTMTEDINLSMKIVATGNRQNRIVYGADIMAMTEPVENIHALLRQRFRWKYGSLQNLFKHRFLIGNNNVRYTPMLTMYRLPMAVVTEIAVFLLPMTLAYALYLTLVEKSPLLFLGAYTTTSLYMLITLWFDEHLPRAERLYLTIYVPVAYFIFYIMDFIQIITVIECLVKIRKLADYRAAETGWISPNRIGRRMSGITADGQMRVIGDIDD